MRRPGSVIGGLLMLAILAPGALAARLPDWAKAIKAYQPGPEEDAPKELFRILFTERRLNVKEDGTFVVRDRIAKQSLSPHASDEVGLEDLGLHPNAKVTKSRAWHVRPGERAKRSHAGDVVDITDIDAFFSDRKTRVIFVDDIQEGSLVFFEFISTYKPYALGIERLFAYSPLVDRSRFVLELPPEWRYTEDWLHGVEVEASRQGLVTTWEMSQLSFPVEDKLAPPISDRAPTLLLRIIPAANVEMNIPSFANWREVGIWYSELARGRDVADERIQADANAMMSSANGDFPTIVKSCGYSVRDRVRYIAKVIGIGGFRPRYASETMKELWGDCKDKATLLKSILGSEGYLSYPVLVNSTARGAISETIPSLGSFNHMILAIAVPDGQELPAHFAAATLDDKQLGRLVIVDTTDEFTSIGWLSADLSGKKALIAAGEKSHLVTLPGHRPADHRKECTLKITINADHSTNFEAETRRYGELAWWKRRRYAGSHKDFAEAEEARIRRGWVGATVDKVEFVSEDDDGAFVERTRWKIDELPKGPTGSALAPFSGAAHNLASVATKRRKIAVEYGFPRQILYKFEISGLPAELSLPQPFDKHKEGWTVTRQFERDGDLVRGTYSLVLEKTLFLPEEFKSLKSLYRALRGLESTMIAVP